MPRPRNPELPEKLLRRAIDLLDARGGPQFSMRELASDVGYTVTAIYRCYPHRTALRHAMQLQLFLELPGHLGLQRLATDPVAQALEGVALDFLRWGLAHPARYRFMFLYTEPDTELSPTEQDLARAPLQALTQALASSPHGADLDPGATATWLFAGLHGLMALHLAGRLDEHVVPDPVTFLQRHSRAWLGSLLESSSP